MRSFERVDIEKIEPDDEEGGNMGNIVVIPDEVDR
jgi:hypothetical protein